MAKKKQKIKEVKSAQAQMIERIENTILLYDDRKLLYQCLYDMAVDIYSLIDDHMTANSVDGMSDLGFALLYIEPWMDALRKELENETDASEKS